jgi:hypothetical protein
MSDVVSNGAAKVLSSVVWLVAPFADCIFLWGGIFWKVVYGRGWWKLKSAWCTLVLEKEENARKEARGTAKGTSRDHIEAFVVVLNCFGVWCRHSLDCLVDPSSGEFKLSIYLVMQSQRSKDGKDSYSRRNSLHQR